MEIKINEKSESATIAGTPHTVDDLLNLIQKLTETIAMLTPRFRDGNGLASFSRNAPFSTEFLERSDGTYFGLSFVIQPFGRIGLELPPLGAAELAEQVNRYLRTILERALAEQQRADLTEAGGQLQ